MDIIRSYMEFVFGRISLYRDGDEWIACWIGSPQEKGETLCLNYKTLFTIRAQMFRLTVCVHCQPTFDGSNFKESITESRNGD